MAEQSLSSELERLRSRGVTLPRNPRHAAMAANDMSNMARYANEQLGRDLVIGQTVTEEDYRKSMENVRDFGMRRRAAMQRTSGVAGDVGAAIPRFYDPLEYWDISGLPWNVANEGHRHKLHKWLRLYYATHYLVASLVDIFTKFPLIGMELECKDPQIRDFYEEHFFNQLNYHEFLVDLGREFWTVGEAFPLGHFDENLGIWEAEELLNPADVSVDNYRLLGTQELRIKAPEDLKRLVQNRTPPKEYRMLEINFPELIPYLRRGDKIPISSTLLKQLANKLTPFDDHGTPILLRGLRTLLHEEKLLASQDAIAERLYSPLILAKAGIMDFGDGQPPWIPGPEELDAIRDDFDLALASDFRLIVHNIGLDVSNVFGREQMPRLGDDFDRIERRLMQVFGVNPSLLSAGASAQPYASSALQAEFLNQTLKTFQNRLIKHFESRALIVAQAQRHHDYEVKGQTRIPIMEHVKEITEDGETRIVERPKLLIPKLKFQTLDLRDEATERQFLQTLRSMGIPIPDAKMAVGIDWARDIPAMTSEYNKERKTMTISQQRAKMETYTALKAEGLPIPSDLRAEVESVLGQDSPAPEGAAGAGGPGSSPGGAAGPGGPGGGPGGPAAAPGGGIVMPPPPGGALGPGGVGGTPPGGGPPPTAPQAPGPPGTVPQVSNERRPGLTYNTHVESATMSDTEPELRLSDHRELVDEGEETERIIETMPQSKTEFVTASSSGKKYSIIDPDAPPLEEEDEKATSESKS